MITADILKAKTQEYNKNKNSKYLRFWEEFLEDHEEALIECAQAGYSQASFDIKDNLEMANDFLRYEESFEKVIAERGFTGSITLTRVRERDFSFESNFSRNLIKIVLIWE